MEFFFGCSENVSDFAGVDFKCLREFGEYLYDNFFDAFGFEFVSFYDCVVVTCG